ncbi:hypothetical protein [Mycobacteroides abscessus]|uniref:hypothetical protein n=1 Tax=Mycobacteroides abscessus TaxID=36809 RepID=UPI001EF9D413|nr:hypothetical protein [Mycobacteroides abscessus]
MAGNGARWSLDELSVALDRSLSPSAAGACLGRTAVSVKKARERYGQMSWDEVVALFEHKARVKATVAAGPTVTKSRWRAAEIGVVLDESLSCFEAAAQLGRSLSAVRGARSTFRGADLAALVAAEAHQEQFEAQIAKGPSRKGTWSIDELAVALDRSKSRQEAAALLGCSVAAIRYQRAKHDHRGDPVPEHLHGTLRGHDIYGCRCMRCRQFTQENTRRVAERSRDRDRVRRDPEYVLGRKQPWTPQEVRIALDELLTLREAAAQLGRSIDAVADARYRYRGGTPVFRRPGRDWSSEELAIALDRTLSRAQAAEQLGRSSSAIAWARYKYGTTLEESVRTPPSTKGTCELTGSAQNPPKRSHRYDAGTDRTNPPGPLTA